jgi:hypothetical protein
MKTIDVLKKKYPTAVINLVKGLDQLKDELPEYIDLRFSIKGEAIKAEAETGGEYHEERDAHVVTLRNNE